MSGAKEIRGKIKSIQNTQKITRAMEMVSASKMRKAQERMMASRPYAEHMGAVISHLAKGHPEYQHLYLRERTQSRVGIIVVSTDRSLCGGLNVNLFRKVLDFMHDRNEREIASELCLIGSKAEGFFRRYGGEITGHAAHLGDAPTVSDLIGVVKVMLDKYEEGTLDRLFLAYNRYVNTMVQEPQIVQLLPLPLAEEKDDVSGYWDYLYEPDAKEILDGLLRRYMEAQVYQGVIENVASEQAARMVAMKAASDNANDMIDSFQLAYNKARQAAITQELSEIVSGAAAV